MTSPLVTWRLPRMRGSMTSPLYLLVALSIGTLNGVGQVLMRAGGRGINLQRTLSLRGVLDRPLWWLGMVLCWCCGLMWAWLVTRIRPEQAIPIFVGAMYLAAVWGSSLCLGEGVTSRQAAGFALVLCGIGLIMAK